jgi:coatomer protein complex subunit alpha (xenin)
VDLGPTDSSFFVTPSAGVPLSQRWTQKSSLAGEHAAAGAFDTAFRLLSRQIGAVNFEPLKPYFMEAFLASHTFVPGVAGMPSASFGVEKGWTEQSASGTPGAPALAFKLPQLEEKLKVAYKTTTEGKFTEALKLFTVILHTIPLVIVETRKEVDDVKELLSIAKEYVHALRIELARKAAADDPKRQAELAAYFTHCSLQPTHLRLSLQSAMSINYKLKNFNSAATFCRRLLELNPPPTVATKARQVLQACERTPKDEVPLNYDPRNPFVVCAATMTPIYKGSRSVQSPYSGTHYVPEMAGKICVVDQIAKIGADVSGLQVSATQVR